MPERVNTKTVTNTSLRPIELFVPHQPPMILLPGASVKCSPFDVLGVHALHDAVDLKLSFAPESEATFDTQRWEIIR